MKLNIKIILIVLEIALIPLFFFSFLSYSFYKEQINSDTLNKIDAIAEIQKKRIQSNLDHEEVILSVVAFNKNILSNLKSFNKSSLLSSQKNLNNELQGIDGNSVNIKKIFLTNTKGVIVSSTDPVFIEKDVSDDDFFKKGIKKNDLSTFKKDDAGSIVHYLVAPLVLDGETLGVVVVITDADDLINLANDYTGLGITGETLLVKDDGDGNALFLTPIRFDKNAGLVRKVLKEEINVPSIHAIAGEEISSTSHVDYRHMPVFSATRFVKSINIGIVVKIDQAEAFDPIVRIRQLFVFILLGIIVLIILLTIPITDFVLFKEEELIKTKDEFISLASHQFRSPLTATAWSLETLLDGDKGPLNEGQKILLEKIYKSDKNMLELVGGFLDIAKMESSMFDVEKGEVDFVQISDSVLEELESQILTKKINIIKQYAKNVPHLNVGEKTARIILQNLLANAVKYTQENGTVKITIEKSNKKIGGVHISIKDNGYGIPKEAQSRIFSKLFRANNVKEKEPLGTGLGLYLLKTLVDKLDGKVWFESKEGFGTTFYVDL